MNKESVKTIKKGQFIEFSYLPHGEVYTREVLSVDKHNGNHVHIAGIIEDSPFMISHDEIIIVVEGSKETIAA